jgi:hypothetical protein
LANGIMPTPVTKALRLIVVSRIRSLDRLDDYRSAAAAFVEVTI